MIIEFFPMRKLEMDNTVPHRTGEAAWNRTQFRQMCQPAYTKIALKIDQFLQDIAINTSGGNLYAKTGVELSTLRLEGASVIVDRQWHHCSEWVEESE